MELLFLDIFIVGVGLVLLLFVRAMPRIKDQTSLKRGMFERWLTSKLPEKIDAFVSAASLRTLRRIKILTLRLDNGINKKLQSMKLQSGDSIGNAKIDLKKVAEDKAAEAVIEKEVAD